jgi:methylphosphotriester-DNA--protein-cysteine methyltransferase
MKRYMLLAPSGVQVESVTPGKLGGNARSRIYGRLDCPSALRALSQGEIYARSRVFFADEASAVAAGYRPCGRCMPEAYRAWKEKR